MDTSIQHHMVRFIGANNIVTYGIIIERNPLYPGMIHVQWDDGTAGWVPSQHPPPGRIEIGTWDVTWQHPKTRALARQKADG